MFISLEGIDASGKTTQSRLIAERLGAENINTYCTHEPNRNDPFGSAIRELMALADSDCDTELLLIYGARREHLLRTIKPKLAEGITVICDRYYDSSVAYFAINKNLKESISVVDWLHEKFAFNLRPKLTFLMDLDPESTKERMAIRSTGYDKYDSMSLQDTAKIRSNFLALAQDGIRGETTYHVVDAGKPQEVIAEEIVAVILSAIKGA